jgi:group I intron endonuclease
MDNGFIYKITSPSNKVYIGQTINFEKRVNHYKKLNCKTQIRLYNSLLKYGFDSHKIEIIENCKFDELNNRERYYQELYDCINKGLNLIYTNTSEKRKLISEETRKKMSESGKIKVFSKEHRENISKAERPKIYINGVLTKTYFTPEHRKKLSDWQIGRIFTAEHKRNITLGLPKKCVYQFDLFGNFVNEYESISEAARQNKLYRQHIGKCCSGGLKTTGKYKWSFKKEL